MKLKTISLLVAVLLVLGALASCSATPTTTAATTSAAATTTATSKVDAVASASVVDNTAGFEKAISKDGTWIIAITKDLTFDKALILDGDFKNGKKDADGKELFQRKIALYSQDANRKVTARFTLTAKQLTINSLNGSIEHGTFKGDLYVNGKNFKLIDQTIDGNVYFASDDIKSTFTMDATSKITGAQEVKAQ